MTGNDTLAARVAAIGRRHPPRTPERRAAGALYASLITTKSITAARKALATFGDAETRAAAAELLGGITEEES